MLRGSRGGWYAPGAAGSSSEGCRALQGWPWASCSVHSFSSEMKSFLGLCCFMEHVLRVGSVPALTELASSWDCQQAPCPRVMELQRDRWAGSQHLLGPLLRFPVGGGKTVMVGGKGAEHTQQISRSPLGKTSSSHQCNPHHHSSPIPPLPSTVGPRRPRPVLSADPRDWTQRPGEHSSGNVST